MKDWGRELSAWPFRKSAPATGRRSAELIKDAANAKKLTKVVGFRGLRRVLGDWSDGGVELRGGAGYAGPVFGNTASRSVMERRSLSNDDARQRGPDMSRAPLRLSPSVALEQELESVIEYFDQTDISPSHFLRRRSHTRAWRSRRAQSHCTAGGSRPCA